GCRRRTRCRCTPRPWPGWRPGPGRAAAACAGDGRGSSGAPWGAPACRRAWVGGGRSVRSERHHDRRCPRRLHAALRHGRGNATIRRMDIVLNGQPRTLAAGTTLAVLLEAEGLAGRRVAVEI